MQSVVVVAVVAVGAVHMGLGSLLRMAVAVLVRRFMGMVMPMIVFSGVVMVMSLVLAVAMRMPPRTVGAAFGLKRFDVSIMRALARIARLGERFLFYRETLANPQRV